MNPKKHRVKLNHPSAFILLVICLLYPCYDVFAKLKTNSLNIHSHRYVIGLDVGLSATTNVGNTTSLPDWRQL